MFTSTLSGLEGFIISHGAWAVFTGSILEQIVTPIPSSLVVLGSSFIIMKGTVLSSGSLEMMFLNITLPAALGVTMGSLLYYGICYKIGTPFVERAGKYMGVSVEDLENVEKRIKESRYENLFLFAARCIPVIPSIAISLFCGMIKYNPRNYVLITFSGALVQASILGIIGWQFGSFYLTISESLSFIDNIILLIIIVAFILLIIKNKRDK
ncbi:SNARE associated Golgi protein [anaerobic digester metagenome]|uniref:Membrane-associated protein n=1 Tax=Methanobacterium subterraneum TaxID=59277 RepID=A0A2H4VBD8_9EURY|nr:VTT domain-containing protein [Methanobacterium subterraneum]AUB55415.1 membrane-associated protein [Methanobacterium subterraneum]PKL73757.1 MAG: membrane-associated protein [Methanobacteriales archaeon HGW-Methanobacteriales-2]